jgi:hypothetical protein
MAGRKALVLTAKEINELGTHILNLPFKRRVEERCLHMLKNKKVFRISVSKTDN